MFFANYFEKSLLEIEELKLFCTLGQFLATQLPHLMKELQEKELWLFTSEERKTAVSQAVATPRICLLAVHCLSS